MNNFFKYGFFLLIAIVIITFVFKGQNSSDKLYIERLENEKNLLKESNIDLQEKFDSVTLEFVVIRDSLQIQRLVNIESENKRRSAKRYYEKRINSRDNLAVYDIDSVFTKRFGSMPPQMDGH